MSSTIGHRAGIRTSPDEKVASNGLPDSKLVLERSKTVTISVLAVSLGLVLCASFARPTPPVAPDSHSITVAPRAPM